MLQQPSAPQACMATAVSCRCSWTHCWASAASSAAAARTASYSCASGPLIGAQQQKLLVQQQQQQHTADVTRGLCVLVMFLLYRVLWLTCCRKCMMPPAAARSRQQRISVLASSRSCAASCAADIAAADSSIRSIADAMAVLCVGACALQGQQWQPGPGTGVEPHSSSTKGISSSTDHPAGVRRVVHSVRAAPFMVGQRQLSTG